MRMNQRNRSLAIGLAGVATLAMLVSACGAKQNTNTPAGPKVAASVDPSLAAMVPASIKSAGVIKIGVDSTYAPSEFLDTDGKTVIGFDVDLFNAVAQKLGLKTQWTSANFDSIIPAVESGKYDIGVSSFTVNSSREQQVTMVSYFSAGTQWATRKGNPSGITPDNACGKKVAVQTGTVQATDDLPQRQKACKSAGKPAIQVDSYQAQDAATNAVVTGKDDAMLADSPVAAYAVQKTNGQLELAGDIYDSAPYGYVLPKSETQFGQAVASAVNALIADGSYKKILDKWNVAQGAITNAQVNPSA